ncbi:MAG: DEAD/DEAH box helicase [Candidatus Lokiarchaeota archaeon]|nr:DEAD/DEAH box helicase [Candidatus Lokiarchaeota archaeon]
MRFITVESSEKKETSKDVPITGMKFSNIPNIPDEIKERLKQIFESDGPLWPPQQKSIEEGVLEEDRFVLGFATAAGKTLIAELKMLKEIFNQEMRKTGKKVIYAVPYKALASDKEREFKKHWGEWFVEAEGIEYNVNSAYLMSVAERISLTAEETETEKKLVENNDILIMTFEKLDALILNNIDWVKEVSLFIIDEGHLINQYTRGPTLEMLLDRILISNIYSNKPILLLSATFGNIQDIANWIGGKYVAKTRNIKTKELEIWRPVNLNKGVYINFDYGDGKGALHYKTPTGEIKTKSIPIKNKKYPINNLIINAMSGDEKQQSLIFCSSRRTTQSTIKQLVEDNAVLRAVGGTLTDIETVLRRKLTRYYFSGETPTEVEELLKVYFSKGFAFHHAGLSSNLRGAIEESFTGEIIDRLFERTSDRKYTNSAKKLQKRIKVGEGIINTIDGWFKEDSKTAKEKLRNIQIIRAIACTPTLAAGVNLPATWVIMKKIQRYSIIWAGWVYLSVQEVRQMFGRAGRPGVTKIGYAVLLPTEVNEPISSEIIKESPIWKKYIEGDIEDITSKLIYLNDYNIVKKRRRELEGRYREIRRKIMDGEDIYDFLTPKEIVNLGFNARSLRKQLLNYIYMFGSEMEYIPLQNLSAYLKKSFFFFYHVEYVKRKFREEISMDKKEKVKEQREALWSKLLLKAQECITFLKEHDMLEFDGESVKILEYGTRVAKLFIDPLWGGYVLEGRDKIIETYNEEKDLDTFSLLHLICMDIDIAKVWINNEEIQEWLNYTSGLYIECPEIDEVIITNEFEQYFKAFKAALILQEWINEIDIKEIKEDWNTYTNDLLRMRQGAERLAATIPQLDILPMGLNKYFWRLTYRIRKGIKEELIPLCRIRGIGRKRGRRLFDNTFLKPNYIFFSLLKYNEKQKSVENQLNTEIEYQRIEKSIEAEKKGWGSSGRAVYNLIEWITRRLKRVDTKKTGAVPTYKEIIKIAQKRLKDIPLERIEKIIKLLIEKKYLRSIKYTEISKSGEEIITHKIAVHNDYLILTTLLGEGLTSKIYRTLKKNRYYKAMKRRINLLLDGLLDTILNKEEEEEGKISFDYIMNKYEKFITKRLLKEEKKITKDEAKFITIRFLMKNFAAVIEEVEKIRRKPELKEFIAPVWTEISNKAEKVYDIIEEAGEDGIDNIALLKEVKKEIAIDKIGLREAINELVMEGKVYQLTDGRWLSTTVIKNKILSLL